MISFADWRIYVVADGREERVESGGLASLGQETWGRDHDRITVRPTAELPSSLVSVILK